MTSSSGTQKPEPWARRVSLPTLVLSESAAAVVAMLTVVPAVTIVDQSIFSNASGREPMFTCMKNELRRLLTNPRQFAAQPAFRWILFVYSSTYIVANNCESLHKRYLPAGNPEMSKFVGTSATNIGASMVKDRAFARLFGAVGHAAGPVPLQTLALFGARDAITVGASFTMVRAPHKRRGNTLICFFGLVVGWRYF